MKKETSFAQVYDSFLSKITDDMYMELTELDTYRILDSLLENAINDFEFPRVNLQNYELTEITDIGFYSGEENNYFNSPIIFYDNGYFHNLLTKEEINILSTYMVVEWIGQQLASIENIRMKYSGTDFKFTSQANHMQKLIQLKKEYERKGFHLQRLYKRRLIDENGIMKSTMNKIMEPLKK